MDLTKAAIDLMWRFFILFCLPMLPILYVVVSTRYAKPPKIQAD